MQGKQRAELIFSFYRTKSYLFQSKELLNTNIKYHKLTKVNTYIGKSIPNLNLKVEKKEEG